MAKREAPGTLVYVSLAAVVALSGCSTPEDADAGVEQQRLVFRDDMRAYYEHLARCLTDLGFPYEVVPSGDGIRSPDNRLGGGSNDVEAYYEASATCEEQVGPHPEIPPLSAEDVESWYDRLVEVGQCLVANGFLSPEPMSKEVYVETYLASLTGAASPPTWSPYTGQPPGQDELAVCPEPNFEEIYYRDQ